MCCLKGLRSNRVISRHVNGCRIEVLANMARECRGLRDLPGASGTQERSEGQFSFALKQDRGLWAWDDNGSGQFGDGTMTDRLTQVQVLNLCRNKGACRAHEPLHYTGVCSEGPSTHE